MSFTYKITQIIFTSHVQKLTYCIVVIKDFVLKELVYHGSKPREHQNLQWGHMRFWFRQIDLSLDKLGQH